MGKILDKIEEMTGGKRFSSYRYCLENDTPTPNIEYESEEDKYIHQKEYAETNHSPEWRDMRKRAEICRMGPPLFKYFLDGSRRIYKVDDMQFDHQVYPVVCGQVSVACCERIVDQDYKFKEFHHVAEDTYPIICLPVKAVNNGMSPDVFFGNMTKTIWGDESKGRVLYYSTKLEGHETLENKGIARIQDEMVECEKRIVAQLMSRHMLTHESYLIKDGSVQYKPMKTGDYKEISRIRNNYRHVVGVSKRFNPNLMKDKKGQSNAAMIAKLPLFHRTPAIMWSPGDAWGGVNFAIWYVRIREKRFTDTPYAGVLKIEKMLMTGEEEQHGLQTDLIDTITANIINERNPVCYGSDARWANHLYPIYMTECYCKSRFQSDLRFINTF